MESLKKINNKYYDFSTKNKSFLKVADYLKTNGVKNYYFMLEIHDIDLVGINPYDENLNAMMKRKIQLECSKNMWYFIREVVRIPQQGNEYIQYPANIANISQAYCFNKSISTYEVTSRQTLRVTSTLVLLIWNYLTCSTGTIQRIISKNMIESKSNIKLMKDIISLLPQYITKGAFNVSNQLSIAHRGLQNNIEVLSYNTSQIRASSIAKGLVEPVVCVNDFEFIENNSTLIEDSLLVRDYVKYQHEIDHKISCFLIASAACKNSTKSGKNAKIIRERCTPWDINGFDMTDYELNNFAASSMYNIVYIEYSYSELGFDEDWYKNMCKSLLNNKELISSELLLNREELE